MDKIFFALPLILNVFIHATWAVEKAQTLAKKAAKKVIFQDDSLVTLSMLRGDAWIVREEVPYFAKVGDILHPGDILQTRENSLVKLTNDQGLLINLAAQSTIKIINSKEYEFLYGRFRLHYGGGKQIYLKTKEFIFWPTQGQLAVDVFQQGARVKTQMASILGNVFLSPVEQIDLDYAYKIDPGIMFDSFLYVREAPMRALSKLPVHVYEKLKSDRMNRYSGFFLFDLVYPENPFPASLGPRYALNNPPPTEKLLPRTVLRARDRETLKKISMDKTSPFHRDQVFYPRGFEDFKTDLLPYVQKRKTDQHIDDFWDQYLVAPLTDYERRVMREL